MSRPRTIGQRRDSAFHHPRHYPPNCVRHVRLQWKWRLSRTSSLKNAFCNSWKLFIKLWNVLSIICSSCIAVERRDMTQCRSRFLIRTGAFPETLIFFRTPSSDYAQFQSIVSKKEACFSSVNVRMEFLPFSLPCLNVLCPSWSLGCKGMDLHILSFP